MYRYEFTSTINDLLDAEDADMTERMGLRRSLRWAVSVFGILWVVGGLIALGLRQDGFLPIIWMIAGSLLLYYFMGRSYIAKRKICRENSSSMELMVEFHDDRIDVEIAGHGNYSREWSELLDFKKAVKGVLLYFDDGTINWLPNRVFKDKAEKESLVQFLHSQAAKQLH